MNVGTVVEFIQSFMKSAAEQANVGAAYGGNMAGRAFDPVGFIKKPQVILRVISIVSLC
jgi:hypothetical protein